MDRPHVLLVILDTLRKDHSVDMASKLKEDGFKIYDKVVTPAPWTVPTHTSLLSGQYPSEHGAHVEGDKKAYMIKIDQNVPLLSEDLQEMGYRTHLITANPYVVKSMGYRGFDNFVKFLHEPEIPFLKDGDKDALFNLRKEEVATSGMIKSMIRDGRYGLLIKSIVNRFLKTSMVMFFYRRYQYWVLNWPRDKGARRINRWIHNYYSSKRSREPDFMMINYMEAHEPYFKDPILKAKLNFNRKRYREVMKKDTLEKVKDRYKENVDYLWKKVDELLGSLKKRGLFDNTVIILISDHGQLLGEHDQLGHGTFLYDELVHVPLMIKYPKESSLEKYASSEKSISPIKLRKFLLKGIKEGVFDESLLFVDEAFSETFGVAQIFTPEHEHEKKRVDELEGRRIAIYYNGYKGVFNVRRWDFEVLRNLQGEDIDDEMKGILKKKIMKFLKRAEGKKISKIVFSRKI